MLFLLSPAKSLDYDTPVPPGLDEAITQPRFPAQTAELIGVLRHQSVEEVAELMALSRNLAELNVSRYAAWSPQADARNSKPAVLAFNGDVYDGLQASSLRPQDLAWAQRHLVILSGLYGLLRPMDRLQPYRLEMGTALRTARGKNLYEFWGDTLCHALNERLTEEKAPVVVNLASQEYFRAVDRAALKARVIECVFEDWKADRYKIISFFAKRARGLMARYAIEQQIEHPEALVRFHSDGYAYDARASQPDRLVFRRRL